MSKRNNEIGHAYEFAYVHVLAERIGVLRPVRVLETEAFLVAKSLWEGLPREEQDTLLRSAEATVDMLLSAEPMIEENRGDELSLTIQSDQHGIEGDVRDILLVRKEQEWEIGLSVKHNNDAVKHSRLSGTNDFGEKWYGVACSETYWQEITPIFRRLEQEQKAGKKWRELEDKGTGIYLPILRAFVKEIEKQVAAHREIPLRLVEYLLGRYDFYKLISVDSKKLTRVTPFNMHGTLNKPATKRPTWIIPAIQLPTKIFASGIEEDSENRAFLCLDKGWSFSLRIHNASTKVEPSLKFDVRLVGKPVSLITLDCLWA